MSRPALTAVVLAAGQGKRLKSDTPKVLHPAAGRPLLAHVVEAIRPLEPERTIVVTSARGSEFSDALEGAGVAEGVDLVVQDPPNGTGDAVRTALSDLEPAEGLVLVTNGDTPLVSTETFRRLVELHVTESAVATVMTARLPDPGGLGRILRSDGNRIEKIVEEVDATVSEKEITEINGGSFVFDRARLAETIGKIDRENAQGEYYLTDVIELLRSGGGLTVACEVEAAEVAGVNDRVQLAAVTRELHRRNCERWMRAGVTIVDPDTTYIDSSVEIGRDSTILPFSFLEGRTVIHERAVVGPQVRVIDSEIGEAASVTFAQVRGSVIGTAASVGPFASLRPGTRLERGAHIGTFVETKNSVIGEGSKANHLAYLGDAEIGRGVNVGAGTITCNWDGREKHRTVIEDDAYIGSDTMLVAPVHVGKRAATGAGAVVRGEVPDDALAVGAPARILEGRGNRMDRDDERGEGEEGVRGNQ